MVSFLKGIDETERKFFYSFLDNLEMKDKKIFIKSFNEKIISSSPKTFPNGMSLGFDYFIGFSDSKIQVDESGFDVDVIDDENISTFKYGVYFKKENRFLLSFNKEFLTYKEEYDDIFESVKKHCEFIDIDESLEIDYVRYNCDNTKQNAKFKDEDIRSI